MRASVLAKRDGRSVIEVQTFPNPEPGPGEALLEVRAAALNHLDLYTRTQQQADATTAPKIIGSDAAGVVSAVGADVETLRTGDAVVLDPGLSCNSCELCEQGEESECSSFDLVGRGIPGTIAELVLVPAANLAPKPEHLDFEQAAALPLDHLTAWRMVRTRGQLRAGETVLIHGIGGGAALAALQIAKLTGAEVIVTSSSDDKLERARAIGADEAINYRSRPEVAKRVRELTDGRGADLVIDTVGAATLPESISAARNGGRVVLCGATTGAQGEVNIREVFWRQISIIGSTMGSRNDFRQMLTAVSDQRIVPVVDSVWHLSELEPALDRLERADQFGKIVLSAAGGAGRWP